MIQIMYQLVKIKNNIVNLLEILLKDLIIVIVKLSNYLNHLFQK